MIKRFTLGSLLIALSLSVQASEFKAPEQIVHSGKTYSLAFQDTAPNGQALYEYTTDGETVDNWTSLVTLNFGKGIKSSPAEWSKAYMQSLNVYNPKPHYKLYTKDNKGYALVIFEPDLKNNSYEANVQKSFHAEACGGLVTYQAAQKYLITEQDPKSKERLVAVAIEVTKMAKDVEESEWQPTCE